MTLKLRRHVGGFLPFALTLILFLLLLAFPKAVSAGVREGLLITYRNVLPAILPFMIFADLIASFERDRLTSLVDRPICTLFHLPKGTSSIALIGAISGYPIGARLTRAVYDAGKVSSREASYLLYLSSIASPAFVITGIGLGVLNDPAIGIRLYLISLISHLLSAVILRPPASNAELCSVSKSRTGTRPSLSMAIRHAADSAIVITVTIAFFSALSALASQIITSKTIAALVAGILEIGSGSSAITSSFSTTAFPILAFAISFSGISVCCQIKSIVSDTDIPMQTYILGKLLSASLALTLGFLLRP